MALTNNRKICPFKEDPKLIKKISYKEYKFLRKFTTEQGKIIPGFHLNIRDELRKKLKKLEILHYYLMSVIQETYRFEEIEWK